MTLSLFLQATDPRYVPVVYAGLTCPLSRTYPRRLLRLQKGKRPVWAFGLVRGVRRMAYGRLPISAAERAWQRWGLSS